MSVECGPWSVAISTAPRLSRISNSMHTRIPTPLAQSSTLLHQLMPGVAARGAETRPDVLVCAHIAHMARLSTRFCLQRRALVASQELDPVTMLDADRWLRLHAFRALISTCEDCDPLTFSILAFNAQPSPRADLIPTVATPSRPPRPRRAGLEIHPRRLAHPSCPHRRSSQFNDGSLVS